MCIRSYYSDQFFCAMRDSVQPPPDIGDVASATVARRYTYNTTNRRREEARAWMREMSTQCDDRGDGFGSVWSVMQWLGTAFVEADVFISTMEDVWKRCDRDSSFGRHIIDNIIQPALRLGIVDVPLPSEFDEFLDDEEAEPRIDWTKESPASRRAAEKRGEE
jgi:hypothetical protein